MMCSTSCASPLAAALTSSSTASPDTCVSNSFFSNADKRSGEKRWTRLSMDHCTVCEMYPAAFSKPGGRRLTKPPPWHVWPSPLKTFLRRLRLLYGSEVKVDTDSDQTLVCIWERRNFVKYSKVNPTLTSAWWLGQKAHWKNGLLWRSQNHLPSLPPQVPYGWAPRPTALRMYWSLTPCCSPITGGGNFGDQLWVVSPARPTDLHLTRRTN